MRSVPVRPAVSVIVPTYQRRELVSRALASVLAQRRDDFEVIVVDDGSSDGTGEALAALGRQIRCIHQEHRGVAAARNLGAALARAPVLAFLDSDDRWLADHLTTVIGALRRHPSAVAACTCPGFRVAGRGQAEEASLVDLLPRLLVGNCVGFVSCTAVQRWAFERTGGFDERLRSAEDTDFWLRLAAYGPFAFVRRRTVRIQATRGSLSERSRRAGDYLSALEVSANSASSVWSDDAGIGPRARGAARFVAALRAVEQGDEPSARRELTAACRLLPEFDREPLLVAGHLHFHLPSAQDPARRAAAFHTAARAWPDSGCDTAIALKGYASWLSLRAGRPLLAARLATALPVRTLPMAARRLAPGLLDVATRRAAMRRHRGREHPDLDAAAGTSRSAEAIA